MHFAPIAFLILFLSSNAFGYSLKVSSFNIRNFSASKTTNGSSTNLTELKKILNNVNTNLIAVQEIVEGEEFKSFIKKNFKRYNVVLSNCGGTAGQKVGFVYDKYKLKLIDFKEDFRLSNSSRCDVGLRPAGIAFFKAKNIDLYFTAISVHLKAGGRQRNADTRYEQYKILTKILGELKFKGHQNIMVMGDFNTTDYLLQNQNYRRFIDFTEINELIDFAKNHDCTAYWSGADGDDLFNSSLLDHILMSQSLIRFFDSTKTSLGSHCQKVQCEDVVASLLGKTYAEVSDHCPISTSLRY